MFMGLLRQRYEVELSEQPDFLVYSVFGKKHLQYDCVRIFYSGENISPNFNVADYAMAFDDMEYGDRYLRLPVYYLKWYCWAKRLPPREWSDEELLQRKFCNFIYSNGKHADEKRERVFHLLSQYKRVDSGGRYLNNIGGMVGDKAAFQQQYKFSIAFENGSAPGYTTEKIYEALVNKTVPIYWGNPEVWKDFNPEAFVNVHDFSSLEAVVERVIELDRDDAQYLRMVKTPFLNNGRFYRDLNDEKILDFFGKIFENGAQKYYRKKDAFDRDEYGQIVYNCGKEHSAYQRWWKQSKLRRIWKNMKNLINFRERLMKKTVISLMMASFLSACATDPYTGEQKVSKTAWGTGIGAAAGAGIGALIGGKKGALIGAGVGAVGGAATGGYMDLQARKLREELQGTGVQVVKDGNMVYLVMPGNVTFDTDKATIKTNFNAVLDSVAKVIVEFDKTKVQITGYTDNTGSLAYNNQLSLARARSVADRLELRGVSPARISVAGMGPNNPIASNATAQGREQNRRVEIQLINLQN